VVDTLMAWTNRLLATTTSPAPPSRSTPFFSAAASVSSAAEKASDERENPPAFFPSREKSALGDLYARRRFLFGSGALDVTRLHFSLQWLMAPHPSVVLAEATRRRSGGRRKREEEEEEEDKDTVASGIRVEEKYQTKNKNEEKEVEEAHLNPISCLWVRKLLLDNVMDLCEALGMLFFLADKHDESSPKQTTIQETIRGGEKEEANHGGDRDSPSQEKRSENPLLAAAATVWALPPSPTCPIPPFPANGKRNER